MTARSDLQIEIKQGIQLPVVALIGADVFLQHTSLQSLKSTVPAHAVDFNIDTFTAPQDSLHSVLTAANTLPLMCPKRLVVVHHIDKYPASDHPSLISYMHKPNPHALVVMLAEKLDLRTKLGQTLSKMCCIFSCDPPKQHTLPHFVQSHAKSIGCSIHHEDASLLIETLGPHTGQLVMALEQLKAFADPRTQLTSDDIATCFTHIRQNHIFELTDAVGHKDTVSTLRILDNILENGENGLVVVAMLVRHVRQLLQTKEALQLKIPTSQWAKHIGVAPFVAEHLSKQVKTFSMEQLFGLMRGLHEMDIALKSSRVSARVLLTQMFLKNL